METMPKIAGLHRRGLTWYVRVRVPKDVLAHFKTKEVNRTLGTRNYDLAAKRIHAVRAGIEAEFDKVRQALKAMEADTDMLAGYSEHELNGLVLKWLNEVHAQREKGRIKK